MLGNTGLRCIRPCKILCKWSNDLKFSSISVLFENYKCSQILAGHFPEIAKIPEIDGKINLKFVSYLPKI